MKQLSRSHPKSNDIELDLGRYELRRDGRRIKLEKKPMELLIFLARRREQLVSREEIQTKLWHTDLFIDAERNINNIVRKIRRALGDNSAKQRFLETVVGKGYRFVGPIRIVSPLYGSSDPSESADARKPFREDGAWPVDRSSLAVLPLRFFGNVEDDGGLSLAFADSLVSRLANLEGVDVLPTSAILNIPSNANASEIASRLGVRFVVHGAIKSSGAESHLSVELFDSHLQSRCFIRKFVLDLNRPFEHVDDIARHTARALKRPLRNTAPQSRARFSRDALAYGEFIQGYRRSYTGDRGILEEAARHLMNALTRDPLFALAHAILSFVCTKLHFEIDPSRSWLEKAEFHCQRALELDAALPEGHVAKAFLLWGPSKNFQHIEAISELKHALTLQKNLPHAYSRLGTILAHIGLLDHSRAMFERGRPFDPKKTISHSIAQVYLWSGEYELALDEIAKWRADDPSNKYVIYFALDLAILTGEWEQAERLLGEAGSLAQEEPMIIALQGVMHASLGESEEALRCISRACMNPKSFGHAHHSYYQIACTLSLLNQPEAAFAWLERSVDTGFACWPLFLKDPCLKGLRRHAQFELLVSSLQAKYPDHLGLL
ncbi:MAG: winged helix-turn-helix domain-containing protein [Candidatus Sulfotelmatobacter sp.]|jgi:DNA-binding winged helix-turn-helix (wHTH) protein/tetratricopeptide (TPR) repeat protein